MTSGRIATGRLTSRAERGVARQGTDHRQPEMSHLPRMPHGVLDQGRGTWAMGMFIATEATLFVFLFFSYYYLGHFSRNPWPTEPPKLTMALIMLVVLVTSSVVLHAGERAERQGNQRRPRVAVAVTI